MTESLIQTEIDRLLASCDGELTTHSRVVDGLLDLRSACENPQLVDLIDFSLRSVPGRNVVQTDWWRDQIRAFQVMVELVEVTDDQHDPAGEPVSVTL